MHYKGFRKTEFIKQFHHLYTAVLAVLMKATQATTDDEVNNVSCGSSLHTSNSESYFPETTYSAAAFDEEGNVLRDNFPLHNTNISASGTETWECSTDLYTIPPKSEVNHTICDTYYKIAECDPPEARSFIRPLE